MTVTVDATTEPVNLIWYAGDSQGQTFRFMADQDTPWDLTGVTIHADARSTTGDTSPLTVSVTDPASGVVTIGPPPTGLEPDIYDYDIQFNDGQHTASWIHGRIRVRGDIT